MNRVGADLDIVKALKVGTQESSNDSVKSDMNQKKEIG